MSLTPDLAVIEVTDGVARVKPDLSRKQKAGVYYFSPPYSKKNKYCIKSVSNCYIKSNIILMRSAIKTVKL